jgi:ubiquitin-protein ligase
MIWYLEDLQRSRREVAELERLVASVDWLTPLGWRIDSSARMIWEADLATPGGMRAISLRYPNHFPHSPPLVLPRGDTRRWSGHQYGPGGELCLEYGPDNWHANITGADMVQSAYRLLQGEQPTPDESVAVASRHRTTLGQDLRAKFSRLVLTRTVEDLLAGIPERVLLSANTIGMYHGNAYAHVISSITLPGGEIWHEELPAPLKHGHERGIALLRWPVDEPLPPTDTFTALRTALAGDVALPDGSYLVVAQGARIRVYFLSSDNDQVYETSTIPAEPVAHRVDADHTGLNGRRAAIVGCGSLGSKIAVSLARSGVGQFLLIDDDVLLPGNLVRHDLDWRDVGTHKADSVAARIQLVHPSAVCDVRKHRLGGQEASGSIETLIESLSGCDLLIDATADPGVFNYLCAAVAVGKKPLLWAEVFGGGFGGLLARHRPTLDPDPAIMRGVIENWCAEKGQPIERAAIDYGGGHGDPAIADDADVAAIAAHAARMGIDMLIPRELSIFPYSVYLIGLSEGWIFKQPFETYPIDVGRPAPEPEEAVDLTAATEELERIRRLYKEFTNGPSSGSGDGKTAPA